MEGGIVCYIDSTNSIAYVAAPSDQSTTGILWGGYGTARGKGTAIGTGEANIAAIVSKLGYETYAAKFF